jgi:hypothetical protein
MAVISKITLHEKEDEAPRIQKGISIYWFDGTLGLCDPQRPEISEIAIMGPVHRAQQGTLAVVDRACCEVEALKRRKPTDETFAPVAKLSSLW